MRVGEVAALKIGDVRSVDGTVKNEIRLDAAQTKGKHARNVFANDRLRKEIASYLKAIVTSDPSKPLFKTQKRSAISANTLCQTLNALYRYAVIDGATSHLGRSSFVTALASKGIGVRVLWAVSIVTPSRRHTSPMEFPSPIVVRLACGVERFVLASVVPPKNKIPKRT